MILVKHAPFLQSHHFCKRCVAAFVDPVEEERVQLEVLGHRGHWKNKNDHHPRNLLESGKDSFYVSSVIEHRSSHLDWIIFKVKAEQTLIITKIEIRNGSTDRAVKRISIEGRGDGKHFEDWTQIDTINKGDDLQLVDVEYAELWTESTFVL